MSSPRLKIVLIEPEIPNNTGNIGRTCVAAGAELHLVGSLGFEISDSTLKRAGLDYWQHLRWVHHPSLEAWLSQVDRKERVFYFSAHASTELYDQSFELGDWLVFGCETKGLPSEILQRNDAKALCIPQFGPVRSLNLANAVSIAAYECLRQNRSLMSI